MKKVDTLEDYATIQNWSGDRIITAAGFQTLDPRRKWKKFYSCRKLSKQQAVPWQDCSTVVQGGPQPELPFTKAATMLDLNYEGGETGLSLGFLRVTWYIRCRG